MQRRFYNVLGRNPARGNQHPLAGSSGNGLLDQFPGAAFAWSLRLLSDFYAGSAIRIERASDSTQQDIGFSGSDLDTAAISTFCSGTTGKVVTWYDQSGNGLDLTEAPSSNGPTIYEAGAVITNGTKAAMDFRSANSDSLYLAGSTASTLLTEPATVFSVYEVDAAAPLAGYTWGSWDTSGAGRFQFRNDLLISNTTVDACTSQRTLGYATQSLRWLSGGPVWKVDGVVNGTIGLTFPASSTCTGFQLNKFGSATTNYDDVLFQEFIAYDSDQGATNVSTIETDMINYWGT